MSTLVLLTHPFEFIKGDRLDPARLRVNRINQTRLRRLREFLSEHPQDFTAVSFGAAGPAWLRAGAVPPPALGVTPRLAGMRMVQNKANDLLAFL